MTAAYLSFAELAALRRIDTATVSNALDSMAGADDLPYSFSSLEMRCLLPELDPMVGYAVTCVRDYSSTPGKPQRREDRLLYEAIQDAPKPVVVVCQYIGPDRLKSNQLGDVMATTFQRLGSVGAITDGGIRDLVGIRERSPGFQVFACGAVAAAGHSVIAGVGTTVSVCGLVVEPGDLLHGDANGVVNVPHALAGLVASESAELLDRERERVAFIQGPEFSVDEMGRRSGW